VTKLRSFDELKTKDPIRLARIAARKAEFENAIRLYELRKDRDLTQVDVAARLGVTQKRVSEIEHAGNLNFETLRNYISALGGRIEVRAIFDDGKEIPFTLSS
jgi:transcriptional regulator with XRE-family HTH domain